MSTFTMQQPGTAQQRTAPRPYHVTAAPTKRCGLIPMRPEAAFDVQIGPKLQKVTARDRRAFPDATGKYLCTHPQCARKFFDSEEQLRRGHDPQTTLEARGETHVYGFWSNDPCNVHPEPGCQACAKACADATKAARAKDKEAAEVAVPCTEHAGGAIGLLTPTNPDAPSA